jgi:hypothetical protein
MVRVKSRPAWLVGGRAGTPDPHFPPHPERCGSEQPRAKAAGEGTDLAREVSKDPLVLDFLGLTEEAQEHAMEEAMTLRMAQTLAEFGPGFAFVGRQYHLNVDGDDFFIDLLHPYALAGGGLVAVHSRKAVRAKQAPRSSYSVTNREPRPMPTDRSGGGFEGDQPAALAEDPQEAAASVFVTAWHSLVESAVSQGVIGTCRNGGRRRGFPGPGAKP